MLVRFNPQSDGTVPESGYSFCNGSIEDITESFVKMEQRGRIIEAVGTLKKYLDGFQELVSEPDSAKRLDESLLSNRERGVLELIKIGLQNKEIDARLGISESTVKKHIVSIFSKAGVSRRAELLVPPLTSWK